MEGITDETYRLAIMKAFPEWDYYGVDFLRVPSVGHYKDDFILEHFGKSIYSNKSLKDKTIFQILTSEKSNTEYTVKQIENLNIDWLDLNLGCPSKTVNSHGGGAFLLSKHTILRKIIRTIRNNFSKRFTVKIRVGYKSDENFLDSLKLFEDEGVDAITIHARTRDQLYKGIANWDYLKQATEFSNLPIIGNGDVWTTTDYNNFYKKTNCHSLMMARGALKTPWMASLLKSRIDENDLIELRKQQIKKYFTYLSEEFINKGLNEKTTLKRFKSFSRYPFDDFKNGTEIKSNILRTQSLEDFLNTLSNI